VVAILGQRGDILMLDNMSFAHGNLSYFGKNFAVGMA
jgi:hypothetical protein